MSNYIDLDGLEDMELYFVCYSDQVPICFGTAIECETYINFVEDPDLMIQRFN